MVDLNRSTRTQLDSERPKLSVGLFREALSHSGARWRGGGGGVWQPPPQVRSRSAKKEVRVRVKPYTLSAGLLHQYHVVALCTLLGSRSYSNLTGTGMKEGRTRPGKAMSPSIGCPRIIRTCSFSRFSPLR